jgi:hypothetical protein
MTDLFASPGFYKKVNRGRIEMAISIFNEKTIILYPLGVMTDFSVAVGFIKADASTS